MKIFSRKVKELREPGVIWDHKALNAIAEAVRLREEQYRLQQHRIKCEDVTRAQQWVKNEIATHTADKDFEKPVHPQLRVEWQAEELNGWWAPKNFQPIPTNALDEFLDWVPEGGFQCPDSSCLPLSRLID